MKDVQESLENGLEAKSSQSGGRFGTKDLSKTGRHDGAAGGRHY